MFRNPWFAFLSPQFPSFLCQTPHAPLPLFLSPSLLSHLSPCSATMSELESDSKGESGLDIASASPESAAPKAPQSLWAPAISNFSVQYNFAVIAIGLKIMQEDYPQPGNTSTFSGEGVRGLEAREEREDIELVFEKEQREKRRRERERERKRLRKK